MLSTKLKYSIFDHPNLKTMPSLIFNDPSEIRLDPSANDIKVYVNNQLLGSINASFPVTLFVQTNGSQKALTMQQITQTEYTEGNTNSFTDTLYFNQKRKNANPRIQMCGSNNNIFKLTGIGWEQDETGQGCTGGEDAFTHVFNVSSSMELKTKMEIFTHNGETSAWMVARFNCTAMVEQQSSQAMAYTGCYCFYKN